MAADYAGVRILAALVVLISTLLGGERALTAGNAVDSTRAGAGVAAISGYVVDDVSYELDGVAIASVSFRLVPATARTVRVRLAPAGAWHSCALAGSEAVCPTTGEPIAAASALEIVAAS